MDKKIAIVGAGGGLGAAIATSLTNAVGKIEHVLMEDIGRMRKNDFGQAPFRFHPDNDAKALQKHKHKAKIQALQNNAYNKKGKK